MKIRYIIEPVEDLFYWSIEQEIPSPLGPLYKTLSLSNIALSGKAKTTEDALSKVLKAATVYDNAHADLQALTNNE